MLLSLSSLVCVRARVCVLSFPHGPNPGFLLPPLCSSVPRLGVRPESQNTQATMRFSADPGGVWSACAAAASSGGGARGRSSGEEKMMSVRVHTRSDQVMLRTGHNFIGPF